MAARSMGANPNVQTAGISLGTRYFTLGAMSVPTVTYRIRGRLVSTGAYEYWYSTNPTVRSNDGRYTGVVVVDVITS